MQELSIFHLNIKDNRISKSLGYSLAAQIFFAHQLNDLHLDLSNNGMDQESIQCLLQEISRNESLRSLYIDITGNDCSSKLSANNLFEAIMSNPFLVEVEILPKNILKNNTQHGQLLPRLQLEIIEEAVLSKQIAVLQFIAFKQNISRYLQGNMFDVFEDLSVEK